MRDYGKLYSEFWTSSDIQSMSDTGKILAAYLLTCHHSNIIGCFRLPDGYVADDLNWSSERVSEGFDELFEKGFSTRDKQSKWVVIHNYIKWNRPENPNQVKASEKAFDTVPSNCVVKPILARCLYNFCIGFNVDKLKPFLNPLETVAEPVTVTVAVTVTEAVPVTGAVIIAADKSAAVKKANEPETELQKACKETWRRYSHAYFNRYGVEPTRNQKVSSLIKSFVQRIGYTESPCVAEFYIGHNERFYVQKLHPVEMLLKDAEGLRTQWATGRKMTQATAQQVDSTQTNLNAIDQALSMYSQREENEQ